ncbi:MAG: hypothetical protein Q9196_004042, partial [Gyalolechia fulgens]
MDGIQTQDLVKRMSWLVYKEDSDGDLNFDRPRKKRGAVLKDTEKPDAEIYETFDTNAHNYSISQ